MCKKSLIAAVFLTLSLEFHAQQRFSAYASAGFTATQVQGDNLGGFHKPGICAGFGVKVNTRGKVFANIELQFVQKGSQKLQDPDNGDYGFYKLKLNYAEIPILAGVQISKLLLFTGPTIGFLLSSSEETEGVPSSGTYPFKKTDISWCGGAGAAITKKWTATLRLSESLLSIRETPIYQKGAFGRFRGQYNTALIFFLNYSF